MGGAVTWLPKVPWPDVEREARRISIRTLEDYSDDELKAEMVRRQKLKEQKLEDAKKMLDEAGYDVTRRR